MRSVRDFALTAGVMTKALAKKISFSPDSDDMSEILARYPQLIVALNHGPMLGPLASTIVLNKLYMENGGGDRKPIVIMWRMFYQIPLYKYAFQYISQVDRGLNFGEFLCKMKEEGFTDLYVKPEGENCNYGDGVEIQPFLSPRFVEFALELNSPILVVVHKGSEQWAKTVPVSDRFDVLLKRLPKKSYDRIVESRLLSIPFLVKRLPELKVKYKLYQPQIAASNLKGDIAQRNALLESEAKNVRILMQEMMDELS
jgi:hypothetical protein